MKDNEFICSRALAAVNNLVQNKHHQQLLIEGKKSPKGGAYMDQQKDLVIEMANKVSSKFKEAKNLLDDLSVDFENNLSANDYSMDYVESCDRLIDDLMSSIRAGAVSIVN